MASVSRRVCTGLLAGCLAAPVPAAAAPPAANGAEDPAALEGRTRVAVLPLRTEGKVSRHLRASVEESLAEGLARGTPDIIPSAALREQIDPACTEADCAEKAARGAHARLLLRTQLIVKKPDYELRLELVDAEGGEVMLEEGRTCDLCGSEELRELAADLAATIGRKVDSVVSARLKPVLSVESRPAGAEVKVDGVAVGRTPLELEVELGSHEIQVGKKGFLARTHTLSFREGVRESLSLTLEPSAPDRTKLWGTLGFGALGLGAGAVVAGAALIGVHDRPITSDCGGSNKDADGDCRFVHKTLGGGITLVVAGGLAVAAGIVLVVLARKGALKPGQARLSPGPLGLRASF